MIHRHHRWTFVAVAATLLATRTARADDAGSAEDQAAAETLFADARALMHDGHIAEACRKFSGSYRLDRATGTLLNLALCHEKEGKIASAWAEYRQAASESRHAGRSDREQIAQDSATALEPRLPKLTVLVPTGSQVASLVVTRNDTPIDGGAWGTPLPVDPGEVEVAAHAPGRKPWSTKITMQTAEAQTITVPTLAIDEQAAAAQKPPYWTGRRTLGTVLGAVGVVAAGTGIYFGLAAVASKHDAAANCGSLDTEVRCTSVGASDSQRAVTQAWVSDFAIGGGVVAFAVGTVLFLTGKSHATEPSPAPAPQTTARVELTPFGIAGAGLRVRW